MKGNGKCAEMFVDTRKAAMNRSVYGGLIRSYPLPYGLLKAATTGNASALFRRDPDLVLRSMGITSTEKKIPIVEQNKG